MMTSLKNIVRVCESQLPYRTQRRRRSILVEASDHPTGRIYRVTCWINGATVHRIDYYKLWQAMSYGEEFLHESTWTDIFIAPPSITRYAKY
jgi:hypothetical protein